MKTLYEIIPWRIQKNLHLYKILSRYNFVSESRNAKRLLKNKYGYQNKNVEANRLSNNTSTQHEKQKKI